MLAGEDTNHSLVLLPIVKLGVRPAGEGAPESPREYRIFLNLGSGLVNSFKTME